MFHEKTTRTDAGFRLAHTLAHYHGKDDAIVVAVPRGGVITAAAVAEALDLPLDVLVVRTLMTPGREDLPMGAIGPDGLRVLDEDMILSYGIDLFEIELMVDRESRELAREEKLYRHDHRPLDLRHQTVILADDGSASGTRIGAAIAVIRRHEPKRIVLALPVPPAGLREHFRFAADELASVEMSVDFEEVPDDEIVRTLARARSRACVVV